MTASEIIVEIDKQRQRIMMETGFSEQVLYISKEYVTTIRDSISAWHATSTVQTEQRICNIPFFTVLETGHIRVV